MGSIVTRLFLAAGVVLALFVVFSPSIRPAASADPQARGPASLVAPTPAEAQPAPQQAQPAPQQAAPNPDAVARGAYLVNLGGCNDCHTPWEMDQRSGLPAPDMSRMLAGHPAGGLEPPAVQGTGPYGGVFNASMTAIRTPFGVVYAANLTPDPETGLGQWSEEQFIRAMRTGMHQGKADGRPILPPMPWPNYANATDEDLSAIFAFLQSLPAVNNKVPDPDVPDEVLAKIKAGAQQAGAQQAGAH